MKWGLVFDTTYGLQQPLDIFIFSNYTLQILLVEAESDVPTGVQIVTPELGFTEKQL